MDIINKMHRQVGTLVTNSKKYLCKYFSLLFLLLIITGLYFVPNMFITAPAALPLSFEVTEQKVSDDGVSFTGYFKQDIPEHERIWLYAENAKISINYGNLNSLYNTREQTPTFFRSPGNGWYCFLSPSVPAGSLVNFTVQSYYGEHEKSAELLFENLYQGDGGDLYRLMFGQIGFFDLILICSLIAGVIYMAQGAIDIAAGKKADGIRIGLFGFYCFSGGLWCATDSLYPFLPLLISPSWMAALLDMSGTLLFPIALVALIHYNMENRCVKRITFVILLAEIFTLVLCLSLQFLSIQDFMQLKALIGMVSLFSFGLSLLSVCAELILYRENYLLLLFLTVFPIFVSQILGKLNTLWSFLPQHTLLQYSFSISVLLLILQQASYANAELIKNKRLQQMEREVEDSHISIMMSQIHPHFLYNSLVGIKQLCDTEPQKASEALEHFSFYLRGNLYSIYEPKLIPFEKETEHVKDYLYLEQMRFEERVKVQWDLLFTDFFLPPLTLQPIVENAVRHGITKKERGGTITIKSEFINSNICVTITDDGVGFDPNMIPPQSDTLVMNKMQYNPRPHIVIDNVRERIKNQCGGELKVYSSPNAGTKVIITIPRKENYE